MIDLSAANAMQKAQQESSYQGTAGQGQQGEPRSQVAKASYDNQRDTVIDQDPWQPGVELRNCLNDPAPMAVLSGRALNTVLADLKILGEQRLSVAPQTSFDEGMLQHINLRPAGAGYGNPGLLRQAGPLTWPKALAKDGYVAERMVVDKLIPEALSQASCGAVDGYLLHKLDAAAAGLRQELTRHIDEMPVEQYRETVHFLWQLGEALPILGNPNAKELLKPSYANATTVSDFARYLNRRNYAIAPALPGDEAAYRELHRSLVAYDVDLRAWLAATGQPVR
jgi:hypothetical protein